MDKEKVIKEFKEICEYTLRPHEFQVLNDVLTLLEEQEPVKPNEIRKAMSFAFNGMLTGFCPRCKTIVNSVGNSGACGKCGQKLDWEEKFEINEPATVTFTNTKTGETSEMIVK